jgi:hypothetical protein
MNGFVTSGRVERVSPRFAGIHGSDRGVPTTRQSEDVSELVEDRGLDPLADRWAAFRERWSALTFYLFDPQSWRR